MLDDNAGQSSHPAGQGPQAAHVRFGLLAGGMGAVLGK